MPVWLGPSVAAAELNLCMSPTTLARICRENLGLGCFTRRYATDDPYRCPQGDLSWRSTG